MEAYLDWQKSGGIKLNDVIEEYKYVAAGKQIKPGDLVNYINGVAGKTELGTSTDTQLSTGTNSGSTISAIQLDGNRVFILYGEQTNYYLYGIVVTIDGAIITYGTKTQLSYTTQSGKAVSACLLPNGNVFIAHSYDSNNYLYGMVCTISGTTISKGTDTQLSTINKSAYTVSTCLLPNGNVFIAHSYGSNYYLYGVVVSIDGETIAKGTDTAIANSESDSKYGFVISTCLLPNGNVFIAHSYGSTYHLYGIVVSISGTTISKGTDTVLNSNANYMGRFISACTLPNGNVFIAHSYGTSYYLYGMVCIIDGTTITKGTDKLLSNSTSGTGKITSIGLLPNGDVFIAYPYNTKNRLYAMVVTIEEKVLIKGTETELYTGDNYYTGEVTSIVVQDNGVIFVAHSGSTSAASDESKLFAQLFSIDDNNIPTNNIVITEYEQQVTPAIEPPFNAVALSSGVGGTDTEHNEQVKIARPNVGVIQ